MKYLVSSLKIPITLHLESPFILNRGDRVFFHSGSDFGKGIVLEEGGSGKDGIVLGVLDFPLSEKRLLLCEKLASRFGGKIEEYVSLHYPSDLDYYEEILVEGVSLFEGEWKLEEFLKERGVRELLKNVGSGFVVKGRMKRPRVRIRREKRMALKATLSEILEADLDEREKEVIEYLMIEGSVGAGELFEKFGSVVVRLIEKGLIGELERVEKIDLREDQKRALEEMGEISLVFGPTGSGKTEVYLKACEKKRCLFLAPEVVLVPQVYRRVVKRLGGSVGIYHSYLSRARRVEEWIGAVSGKTDVLIGTRSAVFVPTSWDLIVVDEEHDESYYQREGVVYDTIEVVKMINEIEGNRVILGSATPRLEDYHRATKGKIVLLRIRRPFEKPEVELVDLRKEKKRLGIAEKVLEKMEKVLSKGMAVMFFVRRKGFGRAFCERCGYTVRCDSCDVSMTYHSDREVFKCHICGKEIEAFRICPVCGNPLRLKGTGSERIEWALKKLFPEASIARADREVVSRPDKLMDLLDDLERGYVDILVGTKMIVKGIDIPRVKLMVISDLDGLLSVPDYTARLRVFQLIVQAAGRSGRTGGGEVIVQHYGMDEELLRYVKSLDVEGFYEEELRRREKFGYPPFGDVIHVLYSASRREVAEELTREISSSIRSGEVLGPSPHPIPKIKGKYTYHFIVKTPDLKSTMEEIRRSISRFEKRGWKILPNPPSLM